MGTFRITAAQTAPPTSAGEGRLASHAQKRTQATEAAIRHTWSIDNSPVHKGHPAPPNLINIESPSPAERIKQIYPESEQPPGILNVNGSISISI
jgi:hypothetical protein